VIQISQPVVTIFLHPIISCKKVVLMVALNYLIVDHFDDRAGTEPVYIINREFCEIYAGIKEWVRITPSN
jgi:hypothetical protein